MAINYINENNDDITVKITNSHFAQLKEIRQAYGIDCEVSALAFVIGVVSEAKGNPITIGDKALKPSDDIKNKNA